MGHISLEMQFVILKLPFYIRIFNFLDVIGPLLIIIAYFLSRGKKPGDIKLVFIWALIQVSLNLLSTILDYGFNAPNYWVYKLNTILSFLVLLLLFTKHLLLTGKRGNVFPLGAAFLLISIALTISGDGTTTYNSYSAGISSFVIVAFSLYYFYLGLLNASPELSIPSTAIFWCVIGIFTYYAGAFFIFFSYKYLIETDPKTVATLWRFHNLVLFIGCLYMSYGILWKDYRTT